MKKRVIGVRHRQKMTTEGEARPTALCVTYAGDPNYGTELLLHSEQDEIDWAQGLFPIKFRDATPSDKPEDFRPWHLQWKKVNLGEEDANQIPDHHFRKDGKIVERLHKVPAEFTGFQRSDTIVMLAGGSGNLFAHLLSRVGEHIDACVMRISAARAKEFRKDTEYAEIECMHQALVQMYNLETDKFRQLQARHRAQVIIEELYKQFEEIQNDRKSCGLRLYQRAKRFAFTQEGVETQEHVTLEDRYKALLANDPIHLALEAEEKRVEREAEKLMKSMPIYKQVFEPIAGIGPRIAMRMIASIPDISAFETRAQFCAFCGVHALGHDGKKLRKGEIPPSLRGGFPRKKRGIVCDWKPTLRQALFLFDDQLNRNPGSVWGAKRKSIKTAYREKHPVPVEEVLEGGKKVKRYTDGHIQNMARWKTLNKFCRFLFAELKRLDKQLSEDEGRLEKVA